jgi:tRNA(Ile)-lysidine synthase
MINEFNKFISENNLIKPGDKILLAVSGGIDSMVMAHLFLKNKYTTGIAHCNFSLRGKDSDKDEELVRLFASQNKLQFFTTKFDTKAYAKENKLSVQMAARDLRYRWFNDISTEHGYDLIAVAHNLNDNIETLLINLTRGTGLAGMTGIRPLSNRIIRPLLFATRQKIKHYRDANEIPYREDRSNADTKYIRNKIRHLVLPVLKEINPSIETTLNDEAERFSGFSEIVAEYISCLRDRISEERDKTTIFNASLLKNHIGNKVILFELFRPFGITSSLLTDLAKVIEGKTGGLIITDTHRIVKNRKEIIITDEHVTNDPAFEVMNIEEFSTFPGLTSARKVRISDTYEIPSEPVIACLDYQKIVFPVLIRKWKAGDYFYPLGMKQKKKLSDYFIDKKYSKFDKENIFILESDGKIVWIIGDRIDDRFRITSHTKDGLLLKAKRKAMFIKPIK